MKPSSIGYAVGCILAVVGPVWVALIFGPLTVYDTRAEGNVAYPLTEAIPGTLAIVYCAVAILGLSYAVLARTGRVRPRWWKHLLLALIVAIVIPLAAVMVGLSRIDFDALGESAERAPSLQAMTVASTALPLAVLALFLKRREWVGDQ